MKNILKLAMLLCLITLLTGCAAYKKTTYLQGIDSGYVQNGEDDYSIKIQPDDLIAIMVNSKDPELVMMFNLPLVTYQVGAVSSLSQRTLGYLVDKEGYINFPQLGKIHIGGKTRTELTNFIQNELITQGFINDPVVTIQFLNFKVSVMGEVARPGTFDVVSDRITIFDALSSAGDLTIYGNRENVKIIREINGKKTVSIVDLRDPEILDSPFYYLQQNDVVYVEPNKTKAAQRGINQNRNVGTFASVLSVLLSAVSIVLTVLK